MDLTTLGYALLFGLSVFTADSVIYADSYSLRAEVHEDVGRAGYTRQYVESYFAYEMRRTFRHESVVKPVALRAGGEASVTAALTDPLGADRLRSALQSLFQVDPLSLEVYLLPAGDDIRAVGFGSRPSGAFFEFSTQAGGRPPQVFLGEVAMQAALVIDPYHARLAQARQLPREGAAAAEATRKLVAELGARAPAAPTPGPSASVPVPAPAPERRDDAALSHLEGMLALRGGDLDQAEILLKRALAENPGMVAAQINLSLVNLLRGRHLPSLTLARQAESALPTRTELRPKAMRHLRGAIYATAAFNAEAVQQANLAETLWQRACADLPQLGPLLAGRGSAWLPARTVTACWKPLDREAQAAFDAYAWELAALGPLPAARPGSGR
ncbi:hypothetical protein [Stella sp.]|uniref:hypothetical protein n=1 Tax=Stella sp. TaxID=2912054 RepID=UPI0035B4986C